MSHNASQLDPSRPDARASSAAAPILLVEDDASLRRSLAEFLKDSGHHPYSVSTMREAQESLRVIAPVVCLLDLNLPDGSGLDLLRQIVQEHLPIRVIVMTAFPLQHLRPRYPESTLVGWLTKPVHPGQLLEAVEAALNLDKGTMRQGDKEK